MLMYPRKIAKAPRTKKTWLRRIFDRIDLSIATASFSSLRDDDELLLGRDSPDIVADLVFPACGPIIFSCV